MIEANKELLFIGGDLSGIQKFIYNISSKKAMISLKGRSAYLSDYTKVLCNGIKDLVSAQSGSTSEIYRSGGKFYLITNDSPSIRDSVSEYYRIKEKELWEEHKGQLGLAIEYVPFKLADNNGVIINGVEYDQIGELWRQISILFSKRKSLKFKDVLLKEYEDFFEPISVGGETKICAITGIEDRDCVRLDKDAFGEEIWVLPSVLNQIDRGKELREKEGFKTLEEYADGTYIGVLRMDVDGLGSRFVKGFGSFDEYTKFSKRLQDFFDTDIRDIQNQYSDNLNIVYAGGDDLFAVGKWDKVLDFAVDVQHSFSNHMREEGLTISGGMAIVGPKFPIAKAAEISGQAEKDAKNYKNGSKNSFSFLGECVSWGEEFDWVKGFKDELVRQISENGVPRALLHRLMGYAGIAEEGKDLSYKWHETYYLTRMIDRAGKGKDFLSELRAKGLTRTKEEYSRLSLAARWAELILRNKDNN